MIEKLIRDYDENNNSFYNLEVNTDKMSYQELIDIYLGYSNSVYFMRYPNVPKILDVICKKIINKINNLSCDSLIDVYADIYIRTLETEERLERNKNYINTNIQKSGINNHQKDLECMIKSFEYVDKLQSEILTCIENKINTMSSEEKKKTIDSLDKKINENETEIEKRKEIIHDESKLKIISKIMGKKIFDVCVLLDYTELETKNNDVYKSLKLNIIDNFKKK